MTSGKHRSNENNNGNGRNGSNRSNGGNHTNNKKTFEETNIGAVPGALMAVFFGVSSTSPFEPSCQKDAADKVKLFVDKKKLVLSNSFSNSRQQQKLEKYGNLYNGKLYDENNIRTMKVDPKKLHCEVRNSSLEGEKFDFVSHPSTVTMTCGANVIENVKNAVAKDNVLEKEHNNTSYTLQSSLQDKREEEEKEILLSYKPSNR